MVEQDGHEPSLSGRKMSLPLSWAIARIVVEQTRMASAAISQNPNFYFVVPVVGLEPTLPFGKQILSLPRLPLRHTGIYQVTRIFTKLLRLGQPPKPWCYLWWILWDSNPYTKERPCHLHGFHRSCTESHQTDPLVEIKGVEPFQTACKAVL